MNNISPVVSTFRQYLDEGIRMGKRDVMDIKGNYTLSFELEMAVEGAEAVDFSYEDEDEILERARGMAMNNMRRIIDERRINAERWQRFKDEMERFYDDFDEWVDDTLNDHMSVVAEEILVPSYEPIYGWVDDVKDAVYMDEDMDVMIRLEEMDSVDDIVNTFDVDENTLISRMRNEPVIDEEYDYYINETLSNSDEAAEEFFNDDRSYYISMADAEIGNEGSRRNLDFAFDHVDGVFTDVVSGFHLEIDQSQGVDVELVVDGYYTDIEFGLKELGDALDAMSEDSLIHTNEGTGLHVNIGTWSKDEIEDVDWLKFLVIHGTDNVLKSFRRQYNSMASSKLGTIISRYIDILEQGDNYGPQDTLPKDVRTELMKTIRAVSQKFSTFNLSKLMNEGYIEFRGIGNEDYEESKDEIIFEIRKILKSLEIASDPNAYRNEYMKKLYTLVEEKGGSQKANDALAIHYRSYGIKIPPRETRLKGGSGYDPYSLLMHFVDVIHDKVKTEKGYKSAFNGFGREGSEILIEEFNQTGVRNGSAINEAIKQAITREVSPIPVSERMKIYDKSILARMIKRAMR